MNDKQLDAFEAFVVRLERLVERLAGPTPKPKPNLTIVKGGEDA